jgi:biopolymer transport protein ExbB/TolQ
VIVQYLLKVAMLGSAWVMYLLLGLSVLSVGAMAERWWYFKSHAGEADELGERLAELLEHSDHAAADKLLSESKTIEAEIVRRALRWVHGGPEALVAAIDSGLSKKRKELERGMTLLGTLGNNAPFIGLFGTVIGVIVAFADLADANNKVAMDRVMGGIAEALVATGVGLFVAIPAVIAYNIFQKRITDIEDNVRSIGQQLSAILASARADLRNGARKIVAEDNGADPVKLAAESIRELARASTRDVSAAGTED